MSKALKDECQTLKAYEIPYRMFHRKGSKRKGVTMEQELNQNLESVIAEIVTETRGTTEGTSLQTEAKKHRQLRGRNRRF